MKKHLLITMCIVCLLSGCSFQSSLHVGGDMYYPAGTTAKGGSFGDPHKSRGMAMRPSQGSTRNNKGNKVDSFLRRALRTEGEQK